ncbi:MAG TPA: caspase family protein [Longimicrobium sp.]|nr:caspase family protein [Longimicrobium sp.]
MNRTVRTLLRQAGLFAVLLATTVPSALAAQAERRVALVVGNGAYQNAGPLRNPVNDARAVAQSLQRLGFNVMLRENRSQREMAQDIREFGRQLDQNTVALYYYSGHGIQVKGENYVVPVDAAIENEEEVEYGTINVGLVMAQMEAARSRVNIVFLDACRNNPFARSFRSASQGLAMMNAPAGTFIAYATAPGDVASDGTAAAGNGLYTQQLLRFLNQPGLPIEQMHKQVRIAVTQASNGDQVPWESSSIMGDFYFAGNTGTGTVQTVASTPSSNDRPQAIAEDRSEAVALTPGQRRTGQLRDGDPVMDDGSLFDVYTYEARAGERLSLVMRSRDFDTFLTVGRMNGSQMELLVRDDDSGGGTDSRAEFTVDRDGPIYIAANALSEGMEGSYTIELTAAGGGSRIASGQSVNGSLARTDPQLADSSYYDTYTYQGRQGERITVSMSSSAFDTYLSIGQVVDGRYREVANNDDADGTNSVMEVTLPTAGTYQIRANSYLKHQTGAYTLRVAAGGSGRPQPANEGGIIRPRPQQNQNPPANQGGIIRRRTP